MQLLKSKRSNPRKPQASISRGKVATKDNAGKMTGAPSSDQMESMWARHSAEWRDTAQICSQWSDAQKIDEQLLEYRVRGDWWEVLAKHNITLLVGREYEHLLMALTVTDRGRPHITYLPMPHPSGVAIDRDRESVFIASTRNPNQIFEMKPAHKYIERLDAEGPENAGDVLVPVRSRFLPGSLYMHDIALVGRDLYANAVGHNAVVRLDLGGEIGHKYAWWPKCIETKRGPIFGQNHIQLNSIAAGKTLEDSFFTASSDEISSRRPGHKNYPVDRRGVLISGQTREVVARGLTRPHSARLHKGKVWIDDSGYGRLVYREGEAFTEVAVLPGWTRGLSLLGDIAFVGTSRVIPRFRQYAPGLDVDSSVSGVHAVDLRSGKTVGSLTWPYGNQIFAIEWIGRKSTAGFAFGSRRNNSRERLIFYSFDSR